MHEHRKIMNRFRHKPGGKGIFPERDNFTGSQMKKLAAALEAENYATRKFFAETLFSFLDDNGRWCSSEIDHHIHKIIFGKIIFPVLAAEYRNENGKFIGWLGHCHHFILHGKNHALLEQINAQEAGADSFVFFEFFYGKSFMLDRNQKILDYLMDLQKMELLVFYRECSGLIHQPHRFDKQFKRFQDKLERCKVYCEFSGNGKWNKMLAGWDLLVTHIHKYGEYARTTKTNGFVDFDSYLSKKRGKRKIRMFLNSLFNQS